MFTTAAGNYKRSLTTFNILTTSQRFRCATRNWTATAEPERNWSKAEKQRCVSSLQNTPHLWGPHPGETQPDLSHAEWDTPLRSDNRTVRVQCTNWTSSGDGGPPNVNQISSRRSWINDLHQWRALTVNILYADPPPPSLYGNLFVTHIPFWEMEVNATTALLCISSLHLCRCVQGGNRTFFMLLFKSS